MLEAVAALALMGFALLIATSLLGTVTTATKRVRTGTVMLGELETVTEMMRAGVLPLETGSVSLSSPNADCPELRVNAVVSEGETPNLFHIVLRAECVHSNQIDTKTLTTQIWNP